MEKQVNCDKTTLQTRRVWHKKDLISSKDCSHPSKHLAFLSLQIHHIKQCGTSLQMLESLNADIAMMSKLTLPRLKQLNYLMWYNPVNSKQTKHQRPQLKCYGAMKKKMIHQLPTPLTHITLIKNNNTPLAKVIRCKNLT